MFHGTREIFHHAREMFDHTREMFDHTREMFDHTREMFDHAREMFDHAREMFDHTHEIFRGAHATIDLTKGHSAAGGGNLVVRIALANLRFPGSPAESVRLAVDAIARAEAEVICFPECFVPGYRGVDKHVPPPDAAFLEEAWSAIAREAGKRRTAVVLGTERIFDGALVATALVVGADGAMLGFQDKVQIDPSEEGTYTPGTDRRVFQVGALTFGVVICHEGWRYPETVRWAARRGAQVVFHPHFHEADPDSHQPTFHQSAVLCRAAETTCYFATVNYASEGSPTTTAIANPDGTLLSSQPYGEEGLLIADLDLSAATGLLASRYKPIS